MTASNESLALALLIDATADTARDVGLGILDSRSAEVRRQRMAAQAETKRRAEAVAAAARARQAEFVHLASGALTGLAVGIVINTILSMEQGNGRSLRDEFGISAGWAMIILLVTVGLGLAFALYDYSEDLDFGETVILGGMLGGPLTAICVALGVLVSEIRDDDSVIEKIFVLLINGGLGGIIGGIAGALFFGAAALVYATIRRIATALTRTG